MFVLLSDLHANLPALEAVAEVIDSEKASRVFVAGDLVGYGPHPNEVVEFAASRGWSCVCGNHDAAAVGRMETRRFNAHAAEALRWTEQTIDTHTRRFLEALPVTLKSEEFQIVHGSLTHPFEEYIFSVGSARRNLERQERPLCVNGHTHMPAVFEETAEGMVRGRLLAEGETVKIETARRRVVNAGSVGQPRDEDPRAALLFLDEKRGILTLKRVSYDVAAVQEDMRRAGLPRVLIERLHSGL